MKNNNPLNHIDFYKVDHRSQYVKGTRLIFSNLTPRGSRIEGISHIIFFMLQYFIKEYLISKWNTEFFNKPKEEVVSNYAKRINNSLGKDAITFKHIEDLHDLGYLPICIMALPEGSRVPMRVSPMVMWNTVPDFFWITNYLETILSCTIWGGCTSATIADKYKSIIKERVKQSGGPTEAIQWMGHDFSFRGMFGLEAACMSGAAHLLSFTGTDNVSSIDFLEEYYEANSSKELIGASVPATEHSVMCMGGQIGEIETFRRLFNDIYPKGIISIVSDTWDFWEVITGYLPKVKNEILSREGKVVIRPDSGDPIKIICGDPQAKKGSPEYKGALECLWDVFGGTYTDSGYRLLDSHIGLIYGDSITIPRCDIICTTLLTKKFCPTNVVFGIGSYTYQYNTRDTFGFAVKATYGEVDTGKAVETRNIFKNPKTDSGLKKSAKGLIAVYKENGEYVQKDEVTWKEVMSCEFQKVFENGKEFNIQTLQQIRNKLT
jgi:nicotinamide phosphoribosyltransferase